MSVDLGWMERHLAVICIDRYVHDLRVACQEDQGTAEGNPGTLGHGLQRDLTALKAKLEPHA